MALWYTLAKGFTMNSNVLVTVQPPSSFTNEGTVTEMFEFFVKPLASVYQVAMQVVLCLLSSLHGCAGVNQMCVAL